MNESLFSVRNELQAGGTDTSYLELNPAVVSSDGRQKYALSAVCVGPALDSHHEPLSLEVLCDGDRAVIDAIHQQTEETTTDECLTVALFSVTETFLQARLQHLGHEVFCCLFLDNRHRVLRFEELFRGTIDGTSVYPREVVKEALAVNAAAVILAHNHPSGVAEPIQADERITRRLKSALELVDIRLLDHLIIGDGTTTSLASRGLV